MNLLEKYQEMANVLMSLRHHAKYVITEEGHEVFLHIEVLKENLIEVFDHEKEKLLEIQEAHSLMKIHGLQSLVASYAHLKNNFKTFGEMKDGEISKLEEFINELKARPFINELINDLNSYKNEALALVNDGKEAHEQYNHHLIDEIVARLK